MTESLLLSVWQEPTVLHFIAKPNYCRRPYNTPGQNIASRIHPAHNHRICIQPLHINIKYSRDLAASEDLNSHWQPLKTRILIADTARHTLKTLAFWKVSKLKKGLSYTNMIADRVVLCITSYNLKLLWLIAQCKTTILVARQMDKEINFESQCKWDSEDRQLVYWVCHSYIQYITTSRLTREADAPFRKLFIKSRTGVKLWQLLLTPSCIHYRRHFKVWSTNIGRKYESLLCVRCLVRYNITSQSWKWGLDVHLESAPHCDTDIPAVLPYAGALSKTKHDYTGHSSSTQQESCAYISDHDQMMNSKKVVWWSVWD